MQLKYHHPQPEFAVLATDVVFFKLENNQLKTLLIQPKNPRYRNTWAAPGGLIRPLESLDQAAQRFIKNFISLSPNLLYSEQLYTFGDPKRDSSGRVVSVAYICLVPPATLNKTTTDFPVAAWFPVTNLPALAYDHQDIITEAVSRLQAKLAYTNIIKALLPAEFSLTQLQTSYEIILNQSLDKRNFRKKIKSLRLTKPLAKKSRGVAHRPAQLFTFIDAQFKEISIL